LTLIRHMYKKLKLDFNLVKNETKFIKIEWTSFSSPLPAIVPELEAKEELLTIKHNYEKPLPFNKQERRAKRAG